MSRDLSTGTFQHNVGEAGCQIFSQISLTFKKSVESDKEKLYWGEAVVALSSQGSPAQQREGETEGDHLAVLT